MAVDAKYVRTVAPAGGVINFVSITGNSHRYFWVNSSAIKLMIERGIQVFEKLKTPDAKGNLEIELTMDNYESNNAGVVFDETSGEIVVKNIEEERALELKEAQDKFLEELGLKIAEELEEKVNKTKEPDTELSTTESIPSGGVSTGPETGLGFSGLTGSGQTMIEEDGEF